jgi:RNA polymerase sigma-70 factor (ECF subfamily)
MLADDICQEVFLKLWLKKDFVSQIEDVKCYLYRAARNEFIDYTRKEKAKENFVNYFKAQLELSNITEEAIYQKEMEAVFQQAIQRLSPQCKKVYLLAKLERMPLEKLARILNVSHQTIKNQVHTANIEVRKYVNEKMGIQRNKQYTGGKVKQHLFTQAKILKAS